MKKTVFRAAFSLFCALVLSVSVSAAQMLIPVGEVIGIELSDGSVSVAAFDDATGSNARAAGLQVGDKIVAVNEQPISCAQDIRHALERADGTVALELDRCGERKEIKVKPQITAEGPKLGIYLRQGITGLGTVTWYDPELRTFGALGHGVNTPSGELLPMRQGSVFNAVVAGVQKGAVGEPGQLIGAVDNRTTVGELSQNTAHGIFGTIQKNWQGQPLPLGEAEDVQTGEALIRSTVADGAPQEYSVEILKIYPKADDTGRNMLLRITDSRLLETTGGIVQGMSGSPIIQDGKLVGAVTHVLVNDPTTGYGIFIENMLDTNG